MNLFIILLILVANVVAYLLIFHSLGKQIDSNKKMIFSLIIIGAMYIITLIVYFLSGIGIEKFPNGEELRNYLMMAFVPVNIIIIIPYSIYSFMKAKKGDISKQLLNKRLIVIELIAVAILVIEFFYFRSSQKNMKKLAAEAQNLLNNQETVENVEKQNLENNEIINNNVTETIFNGETSNTVNVESNNNEVSGEKKSNENLVENKE